MRPFVATVKPVRIIGKAKLLARQKELISYARAMLNTASAVMNSPELKVKHSKVLDLIRGAQDCLIRAEEIELAIKPAVK